MSTQSFSSLRLSPADRDQGEFATFMLAYAVAYERSSHDHRKAFAATAAWAINRLKMPVACWVSSAMIATKRPTHALLFPLPSGLGYAGLVVGGVSRLYEMDIMFDPAIGIPGWRLIQGDAVDLYQSWAVEAIEL
jgi:hypothetical protein